VICGTILEKTIETMESELYKKVVDTSLNYTTRFLSPLIFTARGDESLRVLLNFGLINVYVDDYGYKSKYLYCLFYLFKPTDKAAFEEFQKKITSFDSFYDYYEVEDKIMFVFRVNSIYRRDIEMFKQNRFHDMSEDYKLLFHRNIKFNDIDMDLPKEIYRFEEYLT
jgi:hypothetical protein